MFKRQEKKVEVTWDLLKKERDDPKLLSELEKKVLLEHHRVCKKRDRELTKENDRIKYDCKLLTSGSQKSLIPAYGWLHPVKEMAYELEALNIVAKKFHSVIIFEQIKEKFGTFRGYYSIYPVDHLAYKILTWPIHSLRNLLEEKINYRQTYVEIHPRHMVEKYVEIEPNDKLDDAKSVVEIGGRKYLKDVFECPSKSEIAPGRYKIFWKLKNLVRALDLKVSSLMSFANRDTIEDLVFRQALDAKVEKIVSECESKCDDYCIRCGGWIGKDAKRFQTTGWVTYICSRCAKLEKNAIDCSSQSATRAQLAFERRLKRAIVECGVGDAISSNSGEVLKESLDKLGSLLMVENGSRKLEARELGDDFGYEEDAEF